jgi:hypothetical protein
MLEPILFIFCGSIMCWFVAKFVLGFWNKSLILLLNLFCFGGLTNPFCYHDVVKFVFGFWNKSLILLVFLFFVLEVCQIHFVIICHVHYWEFFSFVMCNIEVICLLSWNDGHLSNVKCPKAHLWGSMLLHIWIVSKH